MAELYGLDCTAPACVHDTAQGYRLHFKVRPLERPEFIAAADWPQVKGHFIQERPSVVFRAFQLDSAYAQIDLLGGKPTVGAQVIERHHSLPFGYDARLLFLQAIPLPRIAIYFRAEVKAGEQITPDKAFQCLFMPGASAAERRCAPERKLTEDEFSYVTRGPDPQFAGFRSLDSILRCQHCQTPMPISAFTTLTLREVEKGE